MPEEQGKLSRGKVEKCRYCGRRLSEADPARQGDAAGHGTACGRARVASPEHQRFRPFCSDRCKMAELGLWFEGRYRIGRQIGEVADDAAAGPSDPPTNSS
jgi:endogenous inhibitor of DNA gyrase (YacG/DUF329 family)